ncbi:MAG: hypothetical protein ABEL76_16335 [Bradymonadaceae bacterium]
MSVRIVWFSTVSVGLLAVAALACSDPGECNGDGDCFDDQVCSGSRCVPAPSADGGDSPPSDTAEPDSERTDSGADVEPDTAPSGDVDPDRPAPDSGDVRARFVDLASGKEHNCGLLDDGRVYCWGGDQAVIDQVPGKRRFTAIRSEGRVVCGRQTDGRLHCWGPNIDNLDFLPVRSIPASAEFDVWAPGGGGGDVSVCIESSSTSTKFTCYRSGGFSFDVSGKGGVSDVEAVELHGCAIFADGIQCDNPPQNGDSPPAAPDSVDFSSSPDMGCGVRQANGDAYCCAIGADGTPTCFSRTEIQPHGPTPDRLLDRIVVGSDFTCGRLVEHPASIVVCWDAENDQAVTIPETLHVQKLSAGTKHACALIDDGDITCWGDQKNGRTDSVEADRAAARLE